MLYIFCDSDNGVTTPGTLYQTTSTWPANGDRWSSIANAIANATIQGLADDLTFLIQGTADFSAFSLSALTSALSVTIEGDATGAVWDSSKATILGASGIGGSIATALAVPVTIKNLQCDTAISSGTPRGIYCNGTGAVVINSVKFKNRSSSVTGASAIHGSTAATNVTAYNCISDGSYYTGTSASGGINLQTATVGNFYNCVFRGTGTGATNPDNCVNCAFFGFATQGGSSGNYKYCATVNGTGTNPITVSNWASVFVDYTNFDYRLLAGAALIGAGIGPASDANVPTTDIAGNPRSGTTTDAGAAMYVASAGIPIAWLVA